MRELYQSLPQKPEWLTEEAIDQYAAQMAPPYLVMVYHHFENGFDAKLDYQTLEEAEKAMEAAEAKLDEYALAMEDGMGVQLQMTSAKTKKGK